MQYACSIGIARNDKHFQVLFIATTDCFWFRCTQERILLLLLLLLEKLPNTYTARIGTEIHVTYRICIDIHKAWLQNT